MLQKYLAVILYRLYLVILLCPIHINGRLYALTMATGSSPFALFDGMLSFEIKGKKQSTNAMYKRANLTEPNRLYILTLVSNVDVTNFCALTVTAENKPFDLQYIIVTHHFLKKSKVFSFSSLLNLTSSHIQNGFWDDWGEWSTCPGACETQSVKVRKRKCRYPDPECIGDPCDGKEIEDKECLNDPCPPGPTCSTNRSTTTNPSGYWTQWSQWTGCSNNNDSISMRERTCEIDSVDGCSGKESDVNACFIKDECPTPGLHPVNNQMLESIQHNKYQLQHQLLMIYVLVGIAGLLLIAITALMIALCINKKENSEVDSFPPPQEHYLFGCRDTNPQTHFENYQELN